MSSKTFETHKFASLFATQVFLATLKATEKSYRILRVPRPKPDQPLYTVIVYG